MLYPAEHGLRLAPRPAARWAAAICATGQAGFTRHLSAGEIVEQVDCGLVGAGSLSAARHVVFMVMGEPLANLDRVWAAAERRQRRPWASSARPSPSRPSASCPGIERLAAAAAARQPGRPRSSGRRRAADELFPINRRDPLDLLRRRARYLGQRAAASASSGRSSTG